MLRVLNGGDLGEVKRGLPALYPRLWRFCLMLAGSRAHADDLAQATCERALIKAKQFAAGTRLDSWVFTLARSIWLNELRARKLREGQGLVALSDVDIPDKAPSADDTVLVGQLFDAIKRLPEHQRVTVLLVYVEGYAYKEAAEVLDIPIGTVMSRLAAARRQLNQALTTYEDSKCLSQ